MKSAALRCRGFHCRQHNPAGILQESKGVFITKNTSQTRTEETPTEHIPSSGRIQEADTGFKSPGHTTWKLLS